MRPSRPRSALSCADRHYRSIGRPFDSTFTGADLVADFTYVRVRSGFVYAAFVVDAFAGTILGWDLTATANAAMVERALADALQTRRCQGHPIRPGTIHHSDAAPRADSSGRRNTSCGEVFMSSARKVSSGGRRQRAADRAIRPRLRSPGRPPPSRGVERAFWRLIARGVSSEDAGVAVGVSPPVGSRWFRTVAACHRSA